MMILSVLLFLLLTAILVQHGLSFTTWLMVSGVYGLFAYITLSWSSELFISFYSFLLLCFGLSIYTGWTKWMSHFFYKNLGHFIPKLSDTEEQALKVGDAWLEQMIFTGDINWNDLQKVHTSLTAEEQKFLDEETEILCGMVDEWDISNLKDLPPSVWQYMKDHGFFGLVISKEYGGKGFSARAHSDIIMKIASRSGVVATTVMVPNSLGPGELLMHYGSEEQKTYYLPRLAKGIEIPCFALTEPEAGSDATSIQSKAVVCQEIRGEEKILGLKINLDKRWITLAPIATLIGVAVNLKDPEGLLDGCGQEGITCVLIERNTPNLKIGPRHLPANQPFMNGTIKGDAIFVPISQIIGGQEKAGKGWQMLVECLSIGRAVSLPALGAASSGVSYLSAGAFARLRRQFNIEIVNFEGIQEKLAKVAGLHYLVNVNRLMTLAAVDAGKKPSVASIIAKYFNTELARMAINDAMDVHGGRTVVEGPRNYLINYYQGIPISITVEGANIMSRNLLIFGQGSMVCHPYIRQEFYAIRNQDAEAFHQVFWQHVRYHLRNFCKALVSSWLGALVLSVPANGFTKQKRAFLKLCYSFAWVADLALITLGGQLKRKERLSARLADVLSYLYMALGIFADMEEKSVPDELALQQANWALDFCFAHAELALRGFIREYPIRPLAWLMRLIVAPFGQRHQLPSDQCEKKLALAMSQNGQYRDYLKKRVYLSGDAQQPLDRVELALQQYLDLKVIYDEVPEIKKVKFHQMPAFLDDLILAKKINEAQKQALLLAEMARYDALQVDAFILDEKKPGLSYKIEETLV